MNPYQSIFFVPNLPSFQHINFTKFLNLYLGIFVSNLKSFQHAEKTDQTFFSKAGVPKYENKWNNAGYRVSPALHYPAFGAPSLSPKLVFGLGMSLGDPNSPLTARGYGFQITFSVQAVDYSHFKSVKEDTFNVCLMGFSQSCCLLLVNLKLIWLTIK